MTDTVLTRGLKEHLPFPDSVFESMWKTCSCRRGNRKLDYDIEKNIPSVVVVDRKHFVLPSCFSPLWI